MVNQMTTSSQRPIGLALRLFAVILVLIGAAYAYGGAQLAFLHTSLSPAPPSFFRSS